MLEFILLKKIIPNSICFNAVLGTNCYDSHTKILKIKMLLYFGYCPTQEDVEKAYGFGIPIEDFEKYDIKFNSKMFWCCCEFRIYNKYTKSFISSQADFRKIFLYEGLAMYKIKRYKKVKLDINCLRNACTVKDNVRIINYIIKLGIVPDIVCVKNAIHTEDKSYRYESEIKKFDELYPNIITLNNFMQKNKLICCNETFRYAEELLKLSKKNEK
jgi:hypothetical protein